MSTGLGQPSQDWILVPPEAASIYLSLSSQFQDIEGCHVTKENNLAEVSTPVPNHKAITQPDLISLLHKGNHILQNNRLECFTNKHLTRGR